MVSGAVHSAKRGRERIFRVAAPALIFLMGDEQPCGWINWPVLFAAAQKVWQTIEELRRTTPDSVLEAAEITLSVSPALERIIQTTWAPTSPPFKNKQGMALIETFLNLFQALTK